jgi:hypothetical protein
MIFCLLILLLFMSVFFLSVTVAMVLTLLMTSLMAVLFFVNIVPLWPFYFMVVVTLIMGFRAASQSSKGGSDTK